MFYLTVSMKKIVLSVAVISTLLLFSCKKTDKDYLTLTQWVADSYTINDIEWIDSTDFYGNLRYTFYTDGTLLRSSNNGQLNGHYYVDSDNDRIILLQNDTVQYNIVELNEVSLQIGGRRGADTIFISAYN